MDTDKLKKHVHPFYELLLIEEGQVEYAIENRYYTLQKGDLLLIHPAQYHFVRQILQAPYRRFCLNFSEESVECVALLSDLSARGEKFETGENSVALRLCSALAELLASSAQQNGESLCSHVLQCVLYSLESLQTVSVYQPQHAENNFQKIVDYINLNLTVIRCIEDISVALFFSKSYINHLFKKELNIGVMQYIRNKRVLLAHQRIQEGEKPTDVYAACGFSNYVTFYRAYTGYFGVSPGTKKSKSRT